MINVRKSGIVLTLVMLLAMLSTSVFAQGSLQPCTGPEDTNCPPGETCQLYNGEWSCGSECLNFGFGFGSFDVCANAGAGPCLSGPPCTLSGNICCVCDSDDDCPSGQSCVNDECVGAAFNVFDMFIGFDIAENLLKEKLLFTLHIIKEQLFQTELKIIEQSLATRACDEQPVSFSVSKKNYRYGKLEEIDALLKKLIFIVEKNSSRYDLDSNTVSLAKALEEGAEDLVNSEPRNAFNCKYLAYNLLIGKDPNLNDPDCTCPVEIEEPSECESPLISCNLECVDPDSDINNCGECGTQCNVESGFTTCCPGGNCVNPDTNNDNCGTCGTVCTGGDECQGGNCGPP